MRLVYENVEYLCKQNNISVSELFDLLSIDEEKFYSKKCSKTVKREQSEMFLKIADYFNISQEELENRFYEEPEIIWKLETDKEGLFRDIFYNSIDKYENWSKLGYEDSKRIICDSKYKSFDFDKIYRFIAFRYDTDEYSLVLFNYAVHGIGIDMCKKIVTNDEMINENGLEVNMLFPNRKNLNIEPEIYLKKLYNLLLVFYGIKSLGEWYYNSDYKNDLFTNYKYMVELNIIFSSDWHVDVTSGRESRDTWEDRKRKINSVIDKVIEIGRVPDEKIKELRYDLWHC